ncbi:hypothetical protein WA026_008373 [Henosepilachna vigintioctopunctata]|uniref:Uncharacterized protein n=1 Tax=Henosepilachna vigintioctopunctata TaxID=420089 RepID=A0AAW1UJG5_9CUCU
MYLSKHSLVTQLNKNIKKLEEQLKIVNANLVEEKKKNQTKSKMQKEYNDSEKGCEMCQITAIELDKTIQETFRTDQCHEEYETQLKNHIDILNTDNAKLYKDFVTCSEKLNYMEQRNFYLLEDNKRLQDCFNKEYEANNQNINSIKKFLESKTKELNEFRETFREMGRKIEESADDKKQIAELQAKCDELKHLLKSQEDRELRLKFEKEYLERFAEKEINKNRNLSLQNERLNWKLKHERTLGKTLEERADSGNGNSINNGSNKSDTSSSASSHSLNSDSSAFNADELEECYSPTDEYPLFVKVTFPVQKSNSISYVLEVVEDTDEIRLGLEQIHFRNFPDEMERPLSAEEELFRQYALAIQSGQKSFTNINDK